MSRPKVDTNLTREEFLSYYYLKTELMDFCKANNISAVGSKSELTKRVSDFLDSGKVEKAYKKANNISKRTINEITENTIIETDFVCSERHREFFKSRIGNGFRFNVAFQKWLKSNAGKTYLDAINEYYRIKEKAKEEKSSIEEQFEYNRYIRDFFASNKDKSLADAVKCWNYKKEQKGCHKYEEKDLDVLDV